MSEIKACVFDFDGVILDSAGVKLEVYADMFSRFPDYAGEMLEYTKRNNGFSRYVQFRYFYENVMRLEYTADIERGLIEEFSGRALEKALNAPFIGGAMEFIRRCRKRGIKTYIATGTPHEEILYITARRGINADFDGIYGSPEKKESIIARILEMNGLGCDELMFFGDAMSDYDSAVRCGVGFTGVGGFTEFPDGVRCISDFRDFVPENSFI